ncbi:MAG: hypothetical protein ACI9FR_001508 [Cryomorphaceae bacterium]|jgi:hypothetical protein
MPSLATAMDSNSSAINDESVTADMYFSDPEEGRVVIAQDPFNLEVETLYNPEKVETWFFLPGVVGVLIMQIALKLTTHSARAGKQHIRTNAGEPCDAHAVYLGQNHPLCIYYNN